MHGEILRVHIIQDRIYLKYCTKAFSQQYRSVNRCEK